MPEQPFDQDQKSISAAPPNDSWGVRLTEAAYEALWGDGHKSKPPPEPDLQWYNQYKASQPPNVQLSPPTGMHAVPPSVVAPAGQQPQQPPVMQQPQPVMQQPVMQPPPYMQQQQPYMQHPPFMQQQQPFMQPYMLPVAQPPVMQQPFPAQAAFFPRAQPPMPFAIPQAPFAMGNRPGNSRYQVSANEMRERFPATPNPPVNFAETVVPGAGEEAIRERERTSGCRLDFETIAKELAKLHHLVDYTMPRQMREWNQSLQKLAEWNSKRPHWDYALEQRGADKFADYMANRPKKAKISKEMKAKAAAFVNGPRKEAPAAADPFVASEDEVEDAE